MHELLIEQLNAAHGTSFQLVRRYADGEQGAFALLDAAGEAFALKVSGNRSEVARLQVVAAQVAQLRDHGYPAPRYVLVGATTTHAYSVQAALPGAPLRRVSAAQLPQLLALNALQAGQALSADDDPWPGPVVTPTLEGGPGYCLLEPMRAYSVETAALLDRLQAIVRCGATLALPQGDLVHFDFTPLNILATGERISGVIDWDGICAGDRAFDLVTLLFYSHQDAIVAEGLYAAAHAMVGPKAVALYLAHLAHRQLDWTIRFHDTAAVAHVLDVAHRQLGRFAV